MSDEKLIQALKDLPLFAKHFLKIRTKSGRIAPFELNRAQCYIHERLERQLKETGRVRALILKGRQQGCSTYVQARFFHKVVASRGKKAFILSHLAEASKTLFDITKRYHDSVPEGLLPKPDSSSAKELNFKTLNSGYSVGTARTGDVGRAHTIQLLHASEVAYYPHPEEQANGILQTVSNEPGTEIIMESTANGIGNYFYDRWIAATTGTSKFQAIFVPWYWQEEYKEPKCSALTEEEQTLLETYGHDGLREEHLFWRRDKMTELSKDFETAREIFDGIYPFTALDAFRNPVEDRFIKTHLVSRARKNKVTSESPLVIGVDPAGRGLDRTAIVRRRGRLVYNLETHHNLNTMELAGLIRRIIDKEQPTKVLIDSIGIGEGVVDRLQEIGYGIVEGVNVARTANAKHRFVNLRAELWHDMREWLAGELQVDIPDSDELMGDLTCLGYKYDSNNRLKIESKDDLRGRGMKSPDTADALALTFVLGNYLSSGTYQEKMYPDHTAGMFT